MALTELLKLLLSVPIAIVLIIIGALMAGALVFEEYLGFKPRKESRRVTGFLGIFILASGVVLVFFGSSQRAKPIPHQLIVEPRKLQEQTTSSSISDAPIPNVTSDTNPKPAEVSEAESGKGIQVPEQSSSKQIPEVHPLPTISGLNTCEKYKNYTSESWRREFLHETQEGTWHVFVASLDPGCTAKEAKKLADQYRQRFPNHDFNVMSTVHNAQNKNFRYAIVIAEGLTNSTIAKEIAQYTRECGIAADAFTYQQNF